MFSSAQDRTLIEYVADHCRSCELYCTIIECASVAQFVHTFAPRSVKCWTFCVVTIINGSMFFRIPTETFKERIELQSVYTGTGFCVSHTVGNQQQMIWQVHCRSRHLCVDREVCILYRILLGLEHLDVDVHKNFRRSNKIGVTCCKLFGIIMIGI